MKLYDINPFVTQVLMVCAPPPQVILPILVIMYIVVDRYCKKCAFNRTGLKKLNACRSGGVMSGGRVWGFAGPKLEC